VLGGVRDVARIHYPSCTDSIKTSLQFLCNFVVINASEGSLCFQNFHWVNTRCNIFLSGVAMIVNRISGVYEWNIYIQSGMLYFRSLKIVQHDIIHYCCVCGFFVLSFLASFLLGGSSIPQFNTVESPLGYVACFLNLSYWRRICDMQARHYCCACGIFSFNFSAFSSWVVPVFLLE
jgi:hypothetical protein